METIILNLPVQDILSLTSTCHSLHNFMTKQIWQKLISRDFNITATPPESICQNVYAALYKQNKEHQTDKNKLDIEIVDLRGNLSKYKIELQTAQTKITEIFEPASTGKTDTKL